MSLISPSVAASFSAEFEKFFDYFSRDFVVNKEPLKVLVSPATTPLFGYETQSTPAAYNYIPVQATFKGRISYNKKQSEDIVTEVRVAIARGIVTLIVKEPAKNYIDTGTTLNIEFDGKTFNKITTAGVRKYLNNTYYQYYLEETK
jgi:hypothetical protein